MAIIEVDQSGRIEVLTVDTALGFSDDRQAAILIPAAVKRNCSRQLRARGVRPKLALRPVEVMVSIRMFAGGLFLLMENYWPNRQDVASAPGSLAYLPWGACSGEKSDVGGVVEVLLRWSLLSNRISYIPHLPSLTPILVKVNDHE
jgi:hypothetical protein